MYLANFSDPKVQQKQVRPDTSRYVPNWCKNRPNALVYTTYLLWFGRWFLRLIIIFCFAWVLQVDDLTSAKKRELLHTDAKEKAVDKNKTSRRPRCFFPQAFVLAYFSKWAYGIRLKHKSQTPKLLRKKQQPSSNSLYTHGLSSHTKTLNLPINRSISRRHMVKLLWSVVYWYFEGYSGIQSSSYWSKSLS